MFDCTADCPLRQIVLDYAQSLQPWRPASAFQEVADALNGAIEAQNCSVKPSFNNNNGHKALRASASSSQPERRVLDYPLPSSGHVLFVSPAVASGGDGSQSRPLSSLHEAVSAIRSHRAASGDYSERSTVVLRAGTHHLLSSLELGPQDSHITFQSYPGEDAAISGTVPVSGVTWTKEAAPSRPAYEWRPGTTGEGGFTLEKGTYNSVADAQARCSSLPLCAGFQYNSADPNPTSPISVDFKFSLFYVPSGSGSSVYVRYAGYGQGETANIWSADLSALPLTGPVDGIRVGTSRGIRARYPNAPFAEQLGEFVNDKHGSKVC